jgi:translation initiation factor IF-3
LRQPGRAPFKKKEDEHRINDRIRVPNVRLVQDGVEPRVLSTREALDIAKGEGLDLVEIAPNADPPVVKIIDYSKFKYDQKKKQKELKTKAHKVVLKEIRFGPNTDEHDYEFKLKHAIGFLKSGFKVKAYVHFHGRSIVFKDRGEILLLKFAQALEDVAKVEDLPKLEGKRMILMLSPKQVVTKK